MTRQLLAFSHRQHLTFRTANVDVAPDRAATLGVVPGAHVVFQARDTGAGIPPDVLPDGGTPSRGRLLHWWTCTGFDW